MYELGSFLLLSSSTILCISVVAFIIFIHSHKEANKTLPRGPRGLPYVGSFFQVYKDPAKVLHQWAGKYGSLYPVWLGNQLFLVISDPEVVRDLIIQQGATSASRKEYYLNGIVAAGRAVITTPYGHRWRVTRRVGARQLTRQAVDSYVPNITKHLGNFLRLINDGSSKHTVQTIKQLVEQVASDIMVTTTLGIKVECLAASVSQNLLQIQNDALPYFGPMSNLEDFIPLLQKIPTSKSKKAERTHVKLFTAYQTLLANHKSQISSGENDSDCLATGLANINEIDDILDEMDKIMLLAGFMVGGTSTTSTLLTHFLNLIPTHPTIQSFAHTELTAVTGPNRLPSLSDAPNLPYCGAIMRELERCNPPIIDSPHFTTGDIVYRGFLVPKGTALVINTWGINHDEGRYERPFEFEPSRHLDGLGNLREDEEDTFLFGAGRRICPGILLARSIMFLSVTSLLWAFEISLSPEKKGMRDEDHELVFKPRHPEVERVLETCR